MKVDGHFSPSVSFFSAPVLFLKVISEILVGENTETKASQLGHLAPWAEPRRSPSWGTPQSVFVKSGEQWLVEGVCASLVRHRVYILDCLCPSPFPFTNWLYVPSNYKQENWPSTCITGSSSIRESVLKWYQSHETLVLKET